MHSCMCVHSDRLAHAWIVFKVHTSLTKSLTYSFPPFLVILTHNLKKKCSLEILVLQPGLWNTIHCSSWWGGNCCNIQLEVYGDGWRWIALFVIPLTFSLPNKWTNMDSYTHTWTHLLSRSVASNPPTIIYRVPLTTAREYFRRFGLSGQRFTAECATSLRGGGRPPLSRYYPLPSNINQLLGDSWRHVN